MKTALVLACVGVSSADLCTQQEGINCDGDDISGGQPADSAADCCTQCQSTDGCVAWTWNSGGDKNCYVKTGCSGRVEGQPTISGGNLGPGPAPPSFPWNDANRSADERADLLLKALSTSEKISMMGTDAAAVPRLAVPAFKWGNEGLHGVAWNGRSTVFPVPVGLAATFDREVLTKLGEVDAKEVRAKHYNGDGVGLSLFAPNINIFRDPRWGRGQETYGEDPVLSGELAKAFVSEAQRPFVDAKVKPVIMTDKHYAVYNLESNFAPPLNGTDGQFRLRFYANASESDLQYTYLVSHAHAVEAGVGSVMCAYNAVNGLPMCANKPLLDRLRDELGFEGMVVTDCGAIQFSVDPMHHFDDHATAVAEALKAGVNLNCGTEFAGHIQEALDQQLVEETLVDERLKKSLLARIELGDLDVEDPYRAWYEQTSYEAVVDSEEHRQAALDAALESMVLLRNGAVDGEPLLPLKKGIKVALIGPNANSTDSLLGSYAGCREGPGGLIDPACSLLTVLDGVQELADVTFVPGSEIDSDDASGIPAAAAAAKDADVAIAVLGLKTCQESGVQCQESEALDRHHIHLPGVQEQLLQAVVAANPRTALVLLNGGAISGDFYSSVPAVLEAFYPGALGGRAVAQTLFGESSPAGRLPYTVVQSDAQLANYYSMDMTDAPGRTYRYLTQEPGFAFGFGLSYSSFDYSDASAQASDTGLTVQLSVTNTGTVTSDDVVMVFAGGSTASGAPVQGLVGFQRLRAAAAGSSTKVKIEVSARALAAQGFTADSPPQSLQVGGRAPGSPGKWVDGDSQLPPEPLTVPVDGALLV